MGLDSPQATATTGGAAAEISDDGKNRKYQDIFDTHYSRSGCRPCTNGSAVRGFRVIKVGKPRKERSVEWMGGCVCTYRVNLIESARFIYRLFFRDLRRAFSHLV